MMLLTKADRAALPAIGVTDGMGNEAVAKVKFFDPTGSWTWFATEFDGEDLFFGLVFGHDTELGYFSLSELASIKLRAGLGIERDRGFRPMTLKAIREKGGVV